MKETHPFTFEELCCPVQYLQLVSLRIDLQEIDRADVVLGAKTIQSEEFDLFRSGRINQVFASEVLYRVGVLQQGVPVASAVAKQCGPSVSLTKRAMVKFDARIVAGGEPQNF